MSQEDLYTAPAGWYPDPLGLPQLRWWNSHAWTEQTSAVRQPMVVQDTRFAWADDDEPARASGAGRAQTPAEKPSAQTLRELEPPRRDAQVTNPAYSAPASSDATPDDWGSYNIDGGAQPSTPYAWNTEPRPESRRAAREQSAAAAAAAQAAAAHAAAQAAAQAASQQNFDPFATGAQTPFATTGQAYGAQSPYGGAAQDPFAASAQNPFPTGAQNPFSTGAQAPFGGQTAGAQPTATPSQSAAGGFDADSLDALFGAQQGASARTAYDTLFEPAGASTSGAFDPASLDAIFGAQTRPRASRSRTPIISMDMDMDARRGPARAPAGLVWGIALMPVLQFVLELVLLTAVGQGNHSGMFLAAIAVPYLVGVLLAYFDRRALIGAGFERAPHWAWAFLTPIVYLPLRARATLRETGHGVSPLAVWFGLLVALIVGVIAIPGIAISTVPQYFTHQVEQSIASEALRYAGTSMTVTCPETPPILPGQSIRCTGVSENQDGSGGTQSTITATYDRSTGWVAFVVTDWGDWSYTAS